MMAPKATGLMLGYARVSTDGQSLDAQQADLRSAGCTRIFAEKQSGIVTGRKELMRAIDALGAGDVLVVTRLDRLARSTRDLLNHSRHHRKKGGVQIIGRYVGRHHHIARQIDADRAGWPRRIRT